MDRVWDALALHCDSDCRLRGGKGQKKQKGTTKTSKALAFHASGEAFFEVFEVFVVRFYCPCLNRSALQLGLALPRRRRDTNARMR